MNEVETKPWGKYEILLDEEQTKVKKISINPGHKFSYQSHEKRDEYWTIINGELNITLDGQEFIISYGDSISIPRNSKHRAHNNTDEVVEFVEVQTGLYFGEDEIVRYEDDYGRT